MMQGRRALALAAAALCTAGAATAQSAERGAGLYLQLPGVASCVSCHGPELLANRNGFLRAADNPQALHKALNAVGVMGYLKTVLGDADVADLAAFLGRVAPLASGDAALQVWPLTIEFGQVGFGAVAGPQVVRLRNRGGAPLALTAPMAQGEGFTIDHDCPSTLAAGASCEVAVRFLAGAVGAATGSVVITSAATLRPVLVALGARGISPARAALQWSPAASALNFDAATVGASAVQRVVLVNAGAADAMLANTTLIGPQSGAFVTSGCGAGTVIAPSASCEMTLRYARSSIAGADATLQLRSDGTNPPSLALRADAIAAPPADPAPPTAPAGGGNSSIGWLAALAFAAWRLARAIRSAAA